MEAITDTEVALPWTPSATFVLQTPSCFVICGVQNIFALHSKGKNTLRVWAPHFQILDSTFSRLELDYTFWLDSTLKICPGLNSCL